MGIIGHDHTWGLSVEQYLSEVHAKEGGARQHEHKTKRARQSVFFKWLARRAQKMIVATLLKSASRRDLLRATLRFVVDSRCIDSVPCCLYGQCHTSGCTLLILQGELISLTCLRVFDNSSSHTSPHHEHWEEGQLLQDF